VLLSIPIVDLPGPAVPRASIPAARGNRAGWNRRKLPP